MKNTATTHQPHSCNNVKTRAYLEVARVPTLSRERAPRRRRRRGAGLNVAHPLVRRVSMHTQGTPAILLRLHHAEGCRCSAPLALHSKRLECGTLGGAPARTPILVLWYGTQLSLSSVHTQLLPSRCRLTALLWGFPTAGAHLQRSIQPPLPSSSPVPSDHKASSNRSTPSI